MKEYRELIQQKQKGRAKVPSRNHTGQRQDLSLVSQILEEQSNRDTNIPSGPRSNQTRELGTRKRGKEAREVHKQRETLQRNKLKLAYDGLKVHLPKVVLARKASRKH